jgi:predicted enzyme related to lactoylglutathione lyase
MDKPKTGQISWHDLTVQDATGVAEFYKKVIGWDIVPLSMGEYDDYCMNNGEQQTVAGVCHARGVNAYIPPQWIIYVTVEDLDKSLEECIKAGGKIIGEKRKMGEQGMYCLIQDPAGAYMMLCG